MSVLLQGEKICKEFGDRTLLNNINFEIKEGERIAIVGSNGAGKTTLVNIISDIDLPDSGKICWYKKDVSISYMKQATEYEGLKETLSGGEKTKTLLKSVLFSSSNIMILDEPTNHLDYEGVSWLIKSINKYKGTVIIISHDRYFLDQTVNSILELENGNIKRYSGNYSDYRAKKKKEYEDTIHLYIEQEKTKAKINDQIDELKGWSHKAHKEAAAKARATGNKKGGREFNRAKAKKMDKQIKSRIKRLEKIDLEGVNKPKEEAAVIFNIENAKNIGKVVLSAEEISKSFGKKTLFTNSSFYIKKGEKVGVYGVNGCGKTTLIKALLGEEEVEGELYMSSCNKVGYISQDVIGLNEESTVLELFNYTNRYELGELRTELNLMGFDNDSINKKIGVLSLGERMKLKLLIMIKEQCDILILDEPTNHIDIHVREQLEDALEKYNGTIILITHDRFMLEKICDKLLVFENKKIKRYEFGFKEYLERQNKSSMSKEDKMILENKIARIIGELSTVAPGSDKYYELDKEYAELISQR